MWAWRYDWFSLKRGNYVTIFFAWSYFYSRFFNVRSIGKTGSDGEVTQYKWKRQEREERAEEKSAMV